MTTDSQVEKWAKEIMKTGIWMAEESGSETIVESGLGKYKIPKPLASVTKEDVKLALSPEAVAEQWAGHGHGHDAAGGHSHLDGHAHDEGHAHDGHAHKDGHDCCEGHDGHKAHGHDGHDGGHKHDGDCCGGHEGHEGHKPHGEAGHGGHGH
ncbi:unnamed protein product [Prorocentrum cordatum]|uniref:Uncharacterized protein n=1 Tax=Prorocentrum cordatum TaxID=2364126 RepID=A0ABN9S205_9DINO|nr:unnamed protein product [Polarella glacialis]